MLEKKHFILSAEAHIYQQQVEFIGTAYIQNTSARMSHMIDVNQSGRPSLTPANELLC